MRKRVEALSEPKRRRARDYWERTYDNALIVLLRSSLKPENMTAETLSTRASLIADQTVLRWMERW